MIRPTRRQVLQGTALASVGAMVGTLPTAIAHATLDAEVRVIDAALDFTGDVGYLTVAIENTRPEDGDPFVPAPHVWGRGRQTQMAWPPERGHYPTLSPGETATLRLDAPGEARSVRLQPAEPAQVRVFAKGTERRAETKFKPGEYLNVDATV